MCAGVSDMWRRSPYAEQDEEERNIPMGPMECGDRACSAQCWVSKAGLTLPRVRWLLESTGS